MCTEFFITNKTKLLPTSKLGLRHVVRSEYGGSCEMRTVKDGTFFLESLEFNQHLSDTPHLIFVIDTWTSRFLRR